MPLFTPFQYNLHLHCQKHHYHNNHQKHHDHNNHLEKDVPLDTPFEWSSDGHGTFYGWRDGKNGTYNEFLFNIIISLSLSLTLSSSLWSLLDWCTNLWWLRFLSSIIIHIFSFFFTSRISSWSWSSSWESGSSEFRQWRGANSQAAKVMTRSYTNPLFYILSPKSWWWWWWWSCLCWCCNVMTRS